MTAHQAPPSLGFSRQEPWSGLPFPSPMQESEKSKWSRSAVSDSSRRHGLQPTRLLHQWDFPGKSTGVGCHGLLREWGADVIIIAIKSAMNTMHLNHPETMPSPPGLWKNCLPQNQSLMPKRLETTEMKQELDPVNILPLPVCSIRLCEKRALQRYWKTRGYWKIPLERYWKTRALFPKILSFSKEAKSSGWRKR